VIIRDGWILDVSKLSRYIGDTDIVLVSYLIGA